ENFALLFEGVLTVPSDDLYAFDLYTDDGSILRIADVTVVDNDGGHPPRRVREVVALKAGDHEFQLGYFQGTQGKTFEVRFGLAWATLNKLEGSTLSYR